MIKVEVCFNSLSESQVSRAARDPSRSYIASPAASWLDDFLSWISPSLPHCCRQNTAGQQCPPPDQFPCNMSASACADCMPCFRFAPVVGQHTRPTLAEVCKWFLATRAAFCMGSQIGSARTIQDLHMLLLLHASRVRYIAPRSTLPQ